MDCSFDRHKLKKLIFKYKDETITGVEMDELNQVLKNSSSAREAFLDEVHQSLIIENIFSEKQKGELVSAYKTEADSHSGIFNISNKWTYALGALAVLLLSISLLQTIVFTNGKYPIGEDQVVGTIEKKVGSFVIVGEDGTYYNLSDVDGRVVSGTLKSSSHEGYIRLLLNDGTRLEFVGKGALSLGVDNKDSVSLILHHGILNAKTSSASLKQPLYVHTCQTELKTYGGEFLFTTYQGDSLVQALDGRADLMRRGTNEELKLEKGTKIAISPIGTLHGSQSDTNHSSNDFNLEKASNIEMTIPDAILEKDNQHQILGTGLINNTENPEPWFSGLIAKTEVIDWPSKSARFVDLVHVNIALLSSPSVIFHQESELLLRGLGVNTEWIEIVLHCKYLDDGKFSIFKGRRNFENQKPKNRSNLLRKWEFSLNMNELKDKMKNPIPDSESFEIIHAVVYTSKSEKGFMLENFHISQNKPKIDGVNQ